MGSQDDFPAPEDLVVLPDSKQLAARPSETSSLHEVIA